MGALYPVREFAAGLSPILTRRTEQRIPAVLSIGKDRELLQYRAMVLRLARCTVASAMPEEARSLLAESRFDLVVLGHTLLAREKKALASLVRREHPATKLVALFSGSGGDFAPGLFDEELYSDCGPAELLAAVTRRLG